MISTASARIFCMRGLFRSRPGARRARLRAPRRRPAPDRGGERADRVLRQAEHLADLADRRAAAIGDDGRGDAGAVAAVFAVDVLDHLLAPLVLEIDVDVGRLVALGGDEALEQQVGRRRIDLGDAEAEADRRIGRRAAALAEDVCAAGVADDVVDGEKIGRVVELARSARARGRSTARHCRACRRDSAGGAFPGEMHERVLRRREACAHLVGIFVAQFVEREGQRSISATVSAIASG